MAWISLFAGVLGVARLLRPVSDMTMHSENYHVRIMELTDVLNSGALSPVSSRLFVFVVVFGRSIPFAYSHSVISTSRRDEWSPVRLDR